MILNAAAMSALTMALTDLLPIDPFIHPMPPVLSGTQWLAIHVPIIMVGYSVLALGVVVAHMQIGFERSRRRAAALALLMNDLLYWYMHVGSILLIAGIMTGSMWASSSWGRYWGWDPKEVWSLVAFLAYMAILHARFERLHRPLRRGGLEHRRLLDDPHDLPRRELRALVRACTRTASAVERRQGDGRGGGGRGRLHRLRLAAPPLAGCGVAGARASRRRRARAT